MIEIFISLTRNKKVQSSFRTIIYFEVNIIIFPKPTFHFCLYL